MISRPLLLCLMLGLALSGTVQAHQPAPPPLLAHSSSRDYADYRSYEASGNDDEDTFSGGRFWRDHPCIAIAGGLSEADLDPLQGVSLGSSGAVDLDLGYVSHGLASWSDACSTITRYRFHHVLISRISTSLRQDDEAAVTFDLWRFGLGYKNGFSYELGRARRLTLYNGDSFVWSQLNTKRIPSGATPKDSLRLGAFDGDLRFGSRAESGIQIDLVGPLAVDARFERAIVFPRHLVWKWLGSELIEEIAQASANRFVRSVLRSSPTAAPVLSLLLRGGLSYGIYELRRSKMNWPFASAPPLAFDTVKAGLSFTF